MSSRQSRPDVTMRGRVRLRASKEGLLAAAIVAVTFVVAYVSMVSIRPLFVPDSRYYAAMALWFGGESQSEAARQVAMVSAQAGWATPDLSQLFGWGLVQPRVVLPTLSIPFVKLWGIDGLAVIPGLALVGLTALLAWTLYRRYGPVAGISTVVLILCSSQIIFYGSAMLTESLSALWGALTLIAAWRYQKQPGWAPLAWMILLTIVSAFTRQATLIVAGAFVVAWLGALLLRQRPNNWALPALAVAITSVSVQVLQTLIFPTFSQLDQLKLKTNANTLTEALSGMPQLTWNIIGTDLAFFARSDPPLLVLITLSILSGVVFWRRVETHLLIGAVAGIALYGITNGTPTAFRYSMPGLVFYAASVALLMSGLVRKAARPPDQLDGQEPGQPQPQPQQTDDSDQRPAGRDDAVPKSAPDPQRPTDAAARS